MVAIASQPGQPSEVSPNRAKAIANGHTTGKISEVIAKVLRSGSSVKPRSVPIQIVYLARTSITSSSTTKKVNPSIPVPFQRVILPKKRRPSKAVTEVSRG